MGGGFSAGWFVLRPAQFKQFAMDFGRTPRQSAPQMGRADGSAHYFYHTRRSGKIQLFFQVFKGYFVNFPQTKRRGTGNIDKGFGADREKRLDILRKLWYFVVSGRTGMSACSLKPPLFK